MNWDYKRLLPADFNAASRVWVYQASRLLSMQEALHLEEMLNSFVSEWKAHGDPVKGYANLFFGQFIILMADESSVTVSGCSTDSSVRFIKEVEKTFNIQLFDRQSLAFVINDKVQLLPHHQIAYALEHSFVKPDTLYFNNMVLNRQELEDKWIIPLKDSWLARYL